MKRILIALAVAACLSPGAASAQNEALCQKDLSFAAGTYLKCMQKCTGAAAAGGIVSPPVSATLGKCVDKYVATWPKVVRKYAGKGTSCEGTRYADNGDGTFDDRLTRLTWEKKDDSGGIHDWDNVYIWSTGDPWKETGTAFTTFLKTLNDTGFGGSNGWRLPSVYELLTLVECASGGVDRTHGTGAVCTTAPGLTRSVITYWSSSTYQSSPYDAWSVGFSIGYAAAYTKTGSFYVRAVRGGS